jgi:pSer/pThr/pTyr-binding forkhead associated (FHA) protein
MALYLTATVVGRRQSWALDGQILRVGRSSRSEIPLPDATVSKEHAEFVREGDRWIVRDFGSRNGVFVAYNGDPGTERRVERFNALKNGSIVRFGQVGFTFLLNEGKG